MVSQRWFDKMTALSHPVDSSFIDSIVYLPILGQDRHGIIGLYINNSWWVYIAPNHLWALLHRKGVSIGRIYNRHLRNKCQGMEVKRGQL